MPRSLLISSLMKIPRDYQFMRDHFIQYHVEILQSFEEGWNALPKAFQEGWLRSGKKIRLLHAEFRPGLQAKGFISWIHYVYWVNLRRMQILQSENDDKRTLYYAVARALRDDIQDEGTLYNIPPLSIQQQKFDFEEMDCKGELKFRIAINTLNYILEIQKEKTLKQLLENIKQQGIDTVLTYFKE